MKTPLPAFSTKVKWLFSVTSLLVVSFICASFTIRTMPATIWNQLGIAESTGLENIKRSFIDGYVYTYGASALKKVAVGDRVAVANDVLRYSKEYVNGDDFKKQYQQTRLESKPTKPADAKTKEEIQTAQIASLQKSIDEGEKSMKILPKDMIAPFQEVQQMLKDQIKDYENPESEMLNMLVDAEKFNYKNAMQQFDNNMMSWETNYPEDYRKMVKVRLEKFLQVTADVDYAATTKVEYNLKKFVNPSYERKPMEWKMAYRSGKPVVDAARSFAGEWLKELH